jgi:hypothetical protein
LEPEFVVNRPGLWAGVFPAVLAPDDIEGRLLEYVEAVDEKKEF